MIIGNHLKIGCIVCAIMLRIINWDDGHSVSLFAIEIEELMVDITPDCIDRVSTEGQIRMLIVSRSCLYEAKTSNLEEVLLIILSESIRIISSHRVPNKIEILLDELVSFGPGHLRFLPFYHVLLLYR